MLWVAGIALLAAGSRPAGAYYCEDGQMPAPPEVAATMALPLCGFAATKRWGPNGCQLCDARNMYPNPYTYPYPYARDRDPRRGNAYRERW
jgi:hypothetical protein